MAVGITAVIPSNGHQQLQIPSGNYPWPAIRVLNPNDGVAYVKQNQDCTSTSVGAWDYKIPSQSFALLPGAGEGWQSIGVFYVDLSGAGLPGDIQVYLTQSTTNDPIFQSVGRATLLNSSSVDIVSGAQPSNPGAGIGRLWIDTGGHLNVLQPSGTNYVELDNTNFTPYVQGTALGGDLFGQISAANVGVRFGSAIYYFDQNSTQRLWMQVASGSFNFYTQGGAFQFLSQAGALLVSIGTSGQLNCNGITSAGGITTTGDINVSRGNNTGVVYFGNSGSQYLFYDGSNWQLVGGGTLEMAGTSINCNTINTGGSITIGSAISAQGGIYSANGILYIPDGNTYIIGSAGYIYERSANGIVVQNASGAWATIQCGPIVATNGAITVASAGINVNGNVAIDNASAVYWPNSGGQQIYPSGSSLQINCPVGCASSVEATAFVASGTGYILQGNNSTVNSIYIDGSTLFQCASAGATFRYAQWGAQWYQFALNGAGVQWACSISGTAIFQIGGVFSINFGQSSNGWYLYCYGEAGGNTGWNVGSTRKIKRDIVKIDDALALVKSDVHGYHYTLDPSLILENHPDKESINPVEPFESYGFIGEEWQAVAPHVVKEGTEVLGMDYGQVTAILFHAFKQYMEVTDARLAALEPSPVGH